MENNKTKNQEYKYKVKQIKTPLMEIFQRMTLAGQVAQLMMIDFDGQEISGDTKQHLSCLPWGGVILFSKNIGTYHQLQALNRSIVNLYSRGGVPPVISVDQEGGLVNRADFENMHLSPGNMALSHCGDLSLVRKCAFISGVELRELGFHLNYAPVADVNINPRNPIIGARSFGENPALTAKMSASAVEGYLDAGIAPCAKHFPGHGDTIQDSHIGLPVVTGDMSRLRAVELPPFDASIRAGVPAIMTAHVHYPAIDPDDKIPATMSRIALKEILRDELGFEGLIITDSMLMKAISDSYGPGPGATSAINAGADMVMMCGSPGSQLEAHGAVVKAVEKGDISRHRIDESLARVAVFKEKFVTSPPEIPEISPRERLDTVTEASRRGVAVLNDPDDLLPVELSGRRIRILSPCRVYHRDLFSEARGASLYDFINGKNPGHLDHTLYDGEDPDSLEKVFLEISPESYDLIIMELYGLGRIPEDVTRAAIACCSRMRESGVPVLSVAMASPYGLPFNATATATAYNCSTLSTTALAEKIFS